MSKASEQARARMLTDVPRVPTIQPVEAVNRAKQAEGVPTRRTDPRSPNGVATVNGKEVQGQDTPYTPLPDDLTPGAVHALEGAGWTTLEHLAAQSDDDLLALDGFGPASLKLVRAAQRDKGL